MSRFSLAWAIAGSIALSACSSSLFGVHGARKAADTAGPQSAPNALNPAKAQGPASVPASTWAPQSLGAIKIAIRWPQIKDGQVVQDLYTKDGNGNITLANTVVVNLLDPDGNLVYQGVYERGSASCSGGTGAGGTGPGGGAGAGGTGPGSGTGAGGTGPGSGTGNGGTGAGGSGTVGSAGAGSSGGSSTPPDPASFANTQATYNGQTDTTRQCKQISQDLVKLQGGNGYTATAAAYASPKSQLVGLGAPTLPSGSLSAGSAGFNVVPGQVTPVPLVLNSGVPTIHQIQPALTSYNSMHLNGYNVFTIYGANFGKGNQLAHVSLNGNEITGAGGGTVVKADAADSPYGPQKLTVTVPDGLLKTGLVKVWVGDGASAKTSSDRFTFWVLNGWSYAAFSIGNASVTDSSGKTAPWPSVMYVSAASVYGGQVFSLPKLVSLDMMLDPSVPDHVTLVPAYNWLLDGSDNFQNDSDGLPLPSAVAQKYGSPPQPTWTISDAGWSGNSLTSANPPDPITGQSCTNIGCIDASGTFSRKSITGSTNIGATLMTNFIVTTTQISVDTPLDLSFGVQ